MSSNASDRPSSSEILAQWRREQQKQQRTEPRPSLMEMAPSSLLASPMTAASSTGLTLVTDHDETDLFSEGASAELDETLVGGRSGGRIHSLQQQLTTACRQRDQLEMAVRKGISTATLHIERLADLCHHLAAEEMTTLAAEHALSLPRMQSPDMHLLRSRLLPRHSPSLASAVADKLDDEAHFQHINRSLEHDIPQCIHALQRTLHERVSHIQRSIQQVQQDDQRKRADQLSTWNNQLLHKQTLLESTQQELEKAQTQLMSIQQQLQEIQANKEQAEADWAHKQHQCTDLQLLLDQRQRQMEIMEHDALLTQEQTQEKLSQLAILESSISAQKEELQSQRKSILQQKNTLQQEYQQLQQDTDIYQRKCQDMMIVQTELLELQVLQRTKDEDLDMRQRSMALELQSLEQSKSLLQQEREQLKTLQQELQNQSKLLETRENQCLRDQETLAEEHEQYSRRLSALDKREKELEDDRLAMQNIKAQFAKAVSLAKADIEDQRLHNESLQQKILEEQRIIQQQKLEMEHSAIVKSTQEQSIIQLQLRQSTLKEEIQLLQKQIQELIRDRDKYTALKEELMGSLSTMKTKHDQAQIQHQEMEVKLSHLHVLISEKEHDLVSLCQKMKVMEEQHQLGEEDRVFWKAEVDKLSHVNANLQTHILQLSESQDKAQQQLVLKEQQLQTLLDTSNQRELEWNKRLDELRSREDKIVSEDQRIDRRQTQLKETESKLTKIAQFLKAKEKTQTEREHNDKLSREGDLRHLIIQLKEMIEAEKQRVNQLLSDKEKLEEDSRTKDIALKQLQDICLLENQTQSSDDDPCGSPSLTYARIRQLALQLKQKDDELTKDREFLQEKLLRCSECERRLMEWQNALESFASSLIPKSSK